MRRCIYCLAEKQDEDFNRDHVIPEAFGLFEGNFVLTCVCADCNTFFGKTVELKLARDSLEGHDRVRAGLRPATDFKSIGKRSTTYVEFGEDSGVSGAQGYLVAPKAGGDLGVTVKPRVGFSQAQGGPFDWFPIDGIPTKDELLARGYKRGERLFMQMQGEASIEEYRAALAAQGITFEVDSQIPPLAGEVGVELVYNLGRPEFRALTKMALNYLAAVAGADVALFPAFDPVRRFARYDEGERPVAPPPRARREPQRCHYLSVQTTKRGVVAHLSLLMRVAYYEVTLASERLGVELSSAHIFNLDTDLVTETLPLPIDLNE
jgi:hypothetical protein